MRIFILLLFLVAVFTVSAFAEAVYLKNGRVMVGRIVEKNQTYMVLQRGEGVSAIKTTIFLDDIAKIESEQDYFKNIPIAPSFLGKGQQPSLIMDPDIRTDVLSGRYDSRERIKSLIEGNKQLAAEDASRVSQEPLPEPDEDMLKMIGNPLVQKSYLALAEMEREKEARLVEMLKTASGPNVPQTGNGRISGVIAVPESPSVLTTGGTRALYVHLLREKTKGSFFFPVPMLYSIITPENVALGKASYSVRNIPAGRYKVVAEWDVDDPMIQEQAVNGKRILNYLGSRGDYRGEYPELVEISDKTDITNLNFECTTLIKNDISALELQPEALFRIKDIYFYRPSPDTFKFILVVQNPEEDPLDPLTLDLFINGAKSIFPLEIGSVGPHQEKQYDITEFVDHDRRMKEGGQETPTPSGPRTLVFKISAPWNQEVLFEKTMSVL